MKYLFAVLLVMGSLSSALGQQTKTAAVVFREFLVAVNTGNTKVAAAFFTEDGFIEAPYVASFGMPSRFAGHEAIALAMQRVRETAPDFRFTSLKIIMETPTQIVAEYESEATLKNGRYYKMLYIAYVTIKDDKIFSHREFLNTVPFVEAFFPNGLKDLIHD